MRHALPGKVPACCSLLIQLRHLPTLHMMPQVRAILTGALTMSDGTTLNTATELNSFVYNTIAGWCASGSSIGCAKL